MRVRFAWVVMVFMTCLLVTSCGPRSPKGYRQEGEILMRALLAELEQVECREDLVQRLPILRRIFVDLAYLAVTLQRTLDQDSSVFDLLPPPDTELNCRLRAELVRLYNLDGGRELIESAQRDALSHMIHYDVR